MKDLKNKNKQNNFNAIDTFCYLSDCIQTSSSKMLGNLLPDLYSKNADDDMPNNPFGFNLPDNDNGENQNVKVKEFEEQFKQFANYLGTDNLSTALFIALFSKEILNSHNTDLDDLADFLNVSTVKALTFKKNINEMIDKGLVERCNGHHRRRGGYQVACVVSTALESNEPLNKFPKPTMDAYFFCKMVSDFIENRSDEEIPTKVLFMRVNELEQLHPDLPIVKGMKEFSDDVEVRTIFYEVCDDFIRNQSTNSSISVTLNDIYDNQRSKLTVARQFTESKHPLTVGDMLEALPGSFFRESELKLTEKGKQLFLGDDYDIFAQKSVSKKDMQAADDIKYKQLFYDEQLASQMDFFAKSLQQDQFSALQKRLEEKSQPKGVAALFYGGPGTGKTESVLQLAKATGRSIFHVDIASCRSMWYGETEKLIKNVFKRYRKMCEKEPLQPILLFNEADALFSKRRDVSSSNTAQVENTIQNIILEEMETLDGILIATTNLICNLDSAFARRFLFKIQFNKPTLEAKKSIWLSKLDWLSDEDATMLAKEFDLSGGEIDNVTRKCSFEEVINGERPTMDAIKEWCREERLTKEQDTKIGF